MTPSPEVRPIDVEQARALRHTLLRPHQRPDEIVFPGDDAPDALHLGAFVGEELIGIASVMREPPPGRDDRNAWRVRGMAVVPEHRGEGHAGALLERCLAHALEHGGSLTWCTARVPATGLYRRYGFEAIGEVFEVPEIGPHVEMRRALG